MRPEDSEVTVGKPRKSFLAVTSFALALAGWTCLLLFILFLLVIFPWRSDYDVILKVLSFCMELFWFFSLSVGITALIRIRRKRGTIKGKGRAKIGIWASAIPIMLFVVFPGLMFRAMLYSARLCECDPAPLVAMIKHNFEFKFPENIKSIKAAEADNVGIDRIYEFIVSFTTDQSGWRQFQESFPKVNDANTIYVETDGQRYIHDIYDFMDYDANTYDDQRPRRWAPKWYKTKIKKGKYFQGYLTSKNKKIQINNLCVDVADPENIIVYIQGWGNYYPGYDRHYIDGVNQRGIEWLLGIFSDKMKVKFPPETSIINIRQLRKLYGRAWLKVEINRESLQEFIESSPFANNELRDDRRFCVNDPNVPWWDPEKPRNCKSGETHISDIDVLRILVDLDDPNTAIIYLQWLEE